MPKPIIFILSMMLLISVACTTQANVPEENATSKPEGQNPTLVAGDPIQVQVSLEQDHQIEALIPAAGGSLSATAGDGTVFQLDIPEGALLNDTLIRMIPVSNIEGMPFGSDPLAVQFEPEGLQLYGDAVLTIIPPQEIPIDQQIFFGYQGMGENLALAEPVVDSREIQIVITHFSGNGVTKGFLADIEPVRARLGGDAEKRIQSKFAEALQIERQRQLLGMQDSVSIPWEDYSKEYEEQVLKPRLAAAGESCAAGRLAIQTALGFERMKALLGMDDDANAIDASVLDTVAAVCMKEEYELCRDDHIIHRILPSWLGLERQFALLGINSDGGTTPTLEQAKDYVRKCLTFELEFHSEVNFDDGGDGGFDSTVNSKIKIQFNPADFSMKGESALVNSAFTFKAPDCSPTSNRGGGTFTATKLDYVEESANIETSLGGIKDFTLVYFPGSTSESVTISCDDLTIPIPPTPMWTGMYIVAHENEMGLDGSGFTATEWEIFGDEYFAKKEWIIEKPGDGLIEAGTFKLYHKPE